MNQSPIYSQQSAFFSGHRWNQCAEVLSRCLNIDGFAGGESGSCHLLEIRLSPRVLLGGEGNGVWLDFPAVQLFSLIYR